MTFDFQNCNYRTGSSVASPARVVSGFHQARAVSGFQARAASGFHQARAVSGFQEQQP
jgi:hypothetical protein